MNLLVVEIVSTIAAMAAFIAVVAWAYSGRRTKAFREASLLALAEDNSENRRG